MFREKRRHNSERLIESGLPAGRLIELGKPKTSLIVQPERDIQTTPRGIGKSIPPVPNGIRLGGRSEGRILESVFVLVQVERRNTRE